MDGDVALLWHSFVLDDGGAAPTLSRCAAVTLPATGVDDLVPVPRGRPCFDCLMAATEHLPHVRRTGSAS